GTLRHLVSEGLAVGSTPSYSFAIVCVAVAATTHYAFSYFIGNVTPTIIYYPPVMIATLVGGGRAGAVAAALSSIMVWWAFESEYFGRPASQATELINHCFYVTATSFTGGVADRRRRGENPGRIVDRHSWGPVYSTAVSSAGSRWFATLRRVGHVCLPPNSYSAYLFAFACIAAATVLRLGL